MLNFEVEFGISIILQMGKHNFVTIADLSKEDLLYLIQWHMSSSNILTGNY